MDADLDNHSSIKCTPPPLSTSFQEQMMTVFSQLSSHPSSFVSALDAPQVQSLCKICNKQTAMEGQVIMKEGEIGDYLAILLVGRLSVDQFGKRTACMNCGDAIGEMELCQAGANSRRFATVVALEESVLAEIPYDAFLAYVEGLGSRAARKLSRYMADLVLARVIHHEAEAGKEDRRRLETIGKVRRPAISGPPTNHSEKIVRTGSENGLTMIPALEDLQDIKSTLKATFDRIHLLSSMDEELKALVMKEFTIVKKKHGELIAKKGESLNRFYIIHRGSCGIYVPNILKVDGAQHMNASNNISQSIESLNISRGNQLKGMSQATNRSIGTARSGPGGNTARNDAATASDLLPAIPNQAAYMDTFRTASIVRMQSRPRADTADGSKLLPPVASWGSPTVGLNSHRAEVWRMPSSTHDAKLQALETSGPDLYHETLPADGNTSEEAAEPAGLKSHRHAGSDLNLHSLVHSARVAIDAEGHEAQPTSAPSSKMHGPGQSVKRLANAAHLIGQAAASFSSMTLKKKRKEIQNPFVGLECAKVLTSHNWFCEIALVHESVHENTIICHNEAILLVLDHAFLHQIRLKFEQKRFANSRDLIERAPFAPALKAEQVCNLVDAATTVSYAPGQIIFSEADGGTMDRFYVLAQGCAVETRGDPKHRKDVKEYKETESFCEWSLYNDPDVAIDELKSNPLVTAITSCVCVCIDRHSFNVLLGTYEDLISEFQNELRNHSLSKSHPHFHVLKASAKSGPTVRGGHRHGDHFPVRHDRRKSTFDGNESYYESSNSDSKRSPRKSPRKKTWAENSQVADMPPPRRLSVPMKRRVLKGITHSSNGDGLTDDHSLGSTGRHLTLDDPSTFSASLEHGTQGQPLPSRLKMLEQNGNGEYSDKAYTEVTSCFPDLFNSQLKYEAVDHFVVESNGDIGNRTVKQNVTAQDDAATGIIQPSDGIEPPNSGEAKPAGQAQDFGCMKQETDPSLPEILIIDSVTDQTSPEHPLNAQGSVPDLLVSFRPRNQGSEKLETIQSSNAVDANNASNVHSKAEEDEFASSNAMVGVKEDKDVRSFGSHDAIVKDSNDLSSQVAIVGLENEVSPGENVTDTVRKGPSQQILGSQKRSSDDFKGHDGDIDEIPEPTERRDSTFREVSLASSGRTLSEQVLGAVKTFKTENKDELFPPRTPGELPKTPGGTVLVNPQGWSSTPTFKSPSATPSQSRVGSSHGMPMDRRSRSTKSHVMASGDEFNVPTGNGPEDDSDDDEPAQRPRSRDSIPKNSKGKKLDSNVKGKPRPKSVFGIVEVDGTKYSGKAPDNEKSSVSKIYGIISQSHVREKTTRLHKSGSEAPRVARFDKGQTRSALEWNLLKEAALPGPGAYHSNTQKKLGCVKIGLADRRPVWFDLEKKAAQSPGPGEYAPALGPVEMRARRIAAVHVMQTQRAKAGEQIVPFVKTASTAQGSLSAFEEAVVSCIEKHAGGSYRDLPDQAELCYELRCIDPIKRAYLDHGVEL